MKTNKSNVVAISNKESAKQVYDFCTANGLGRTFARRNLRAIMHLVEHSMGMFTYADVCSGITSKDAIAMATWYKLLIIEQNRVEAEDKLLAQIFGK